MFSILVDRRALSNVRKDDPAMIGAEMVDRRLDELWHGVDDERLWGLMLIDLLHLVVDEWETSRREQGPWKRVFDAHLGIGKQRGWISRSPAIANMFGGSTAELAQLNTDVAGGRVKAAAQKSGACYIATAVYGSYDAPEVVALRRFRDQRLAKSAPGRAFVRAYCAASPVAARLKEAKTAHRIPRRVLDVGVHHLQARGCPSRTQT